MYKRYFLLIAALFIFILNVKTEVAIDQENTIFNEEDHFFLHTIERGQTVYSISLMYGVSTEEIYRLNPDSRNVIHIGDVLKIPQESGSYIYHTIQPKETLYGLSQKYHMKGEDIIGANPGLSIETFVIGKIIRIPTNLVTTPIQGGNEAANISSTNSLLYQISPLKEVNIIKIALLLPFGLKDNAVQKTLQNRMVEYYEGFLLALAEMKKEGISVNLQVYDIGLDTKEISNILKKSEMKDIHLLIGGLTDDQVKMLSRYAKEKNLPYVIPISKTTEPFTNPNVFQVNTPQSNLYSNAIQAFCNRYGKENIIMVSTEPGPANQKDFVNLLKQDLQDRRIPYRSVSLGDNFFNEMKLMLSNYQMNVVVPSDDSAETLSKMVTPLKTLVENQSDLSLALFGYPEWQVYSSKYSEDFFRINTTFFTLFYSDPTSQEVKTFYSTFYKWYNRVLENTFPKYGMLGYDTGMYFIRLINRYGSRFDSNINDLRYTGVQTDFHFERVNNWGGFINTNMYLINYNSNYSITKNLFK